MRQEITERHALDANGNPAGGQTFGVGINILWQNGPLGTGPDKKPPNGAFVEAVIEAVIGRITFYQTASEGRFACPENAEALKHLRLALAALDARTAARERRGVEGKHEP